VKRTILFTPERAKWLKVRAAMAEKEMSAIVEEALALWEKSIHHNKRERHGYKPV